MKNQIIKYSQWIVKGGFSILDQILFSGANFLMSVLLARWLGIREFGLFAFASTFFNLFYQLQNALILEPMNVIGTSTYGNNLQNYLKAQFKINTLLFLMVGLVLLGLLGGIFMITGNPELGRIAWILGILTPLLQLPWLIRRSYYVLNKPHLSALFSGIYGFSLISLLWILFNKLILSTQISFIVMSFAGVLAAAVTFFIVRTSSEKKLPLSLSWIFLENWNYGKWMLISGIFMFLAGQAPIYFAGLMLSTESAGVVKAIQNFILPMSMTVTTITAIAVPNFAHFSKEQSENLKQKTKQLTLGIVMIAFIYEVFLILFGEKLELAIYNGIYHQFVYLLPIWGTIPFLMAMAIGPSIKIRVLKKPQGILITAITWVSITIILLPLFAHFWGIYGLSIAACIGYFASWLSYIFVVNRIEKNGLYE